MSKDFFDIIPHRQQSERHWVVRASGGRFVNHFIKYGVVSIGHITNFGTANIPPSQLDLREIKKLLELSANNEDEKTLAQSTVSNHARQVSDFIHEIKSGDLVITVDDANVAIGRVYGDAFIDDAPLELSYTIGKTEKKFLMPYKLRRKIEWGPHFNRSSLPLTVEYSFRAHQTVFNIDKHWAYFYHLIYPVFRDDSNLYFGININQPKDIDSFYVSQLLAYFSDFEAVAKNLDLDALPNLKVDNLNQLLNQLHKQITHELTCKAEFFSEGTLWWQYPFKLLDSYKKTITLILALQVLFGGEVGVIKSPGIITPKMREDILNSKIVNDIAKNRNIDEVKKRLKVTPPRNKPIPPVMKDTSTTKEGIGPKALDE